MKSLEKPIWTKLTKETLEQIVITPPSEEMRKKVLENWDSVAKPIDSMGRFEILTAQLGAILGTDKINIDKKAIVIMCADNGIVEEGVTLSGQEVTTAVAGLMGKKQSAVGRMAENIGADTLVVDIGINNKEPIPGLENRKIRYGTHNFIKEPAMTEEEALKAISVGIDMVFSCKEAGYTILGTGELGMGNTTTSAAVAAALLQRKASEVTGRGAGLSDDGLLRKQQVISKAIEKYDLYHADALTVLATVGGLDIAGLTGVCIGGAMFHVPIVLDGVISIVAALLAERMVPGTKAFLLPSHKGKEPAIDILSKELGIDPVIDGKLGLGEGTGAVMMFSLLDMALSVYKSSATFEDIQVEKHKRA
ncbi:nicotinate-nucleotide--dimethylbenzimidazole phosphoribosyltransferase [Defluviitalea saccharophila]|jgi:nicotinate-nucleotide--dimethylbenzimidazole phosphoribosyltransferase|uniref:Nicotinate-nucleotide--dimethylbenzimidazole phosphoribosyltransferase n=1 Tax=Defluviitalea saccharophila TaxID=879970 RepID=A0ABZ2Y6W6_9FIRM|nr:nicotinate-nucleotide--dimethylbenzimidazole phosphoribosyltransferase [Candidatus Epulonipiscium sp.]